MTRTRPVVVVGIADGQSDAVVLVAAEFAERFGADLVCAVVDEAHYTAVDRSGRPVVIPIDPDAVDDIEVDRVRIEGRLHDVLDHRPVGWSVRFMTGEPSAAIAVAASDVDALMIVIGTRRRTIARSLREFFAGSIAAHLAHRQARPIVVVPLDPAPLDDGLPWQAPDESRT